MTDSMRANTSGDRAYHGVELARLGLDGCARQRCVHINHALRSTQARAIRRVESGSLVEVSMMIRPARRLGQDASRPSHNCLNLGASRSHK